MLTCYTASLNRINDHRYEVISLAYNP